MSERINTLYNYIKTNTSTEHTCKVSDDIFYTYTRFNALYSMDIILDNVITDYCTASEIVNHYYNYPKVKIYVYNSTVESVNDSFNGKKVYGEEFLGETYELFQNKMVRLHFEKLFLNELEDICYIINSFSNLNSTEVE